MRVNERLNKLQRKRGRPSSCVVCRETVVRVVGGPLKPGRVNPPEPPEYCPSCGRKNPKYTIRMKGIPEKARGDGT